jgi:hypothetical protein
LFINPLSRMRMLASDHRSYAYSKRLVGSRVPMWETKLDRGVRILWTQLRRGVEKPAIIVSGHCKNSVHLSLLLHPHPHLQLHLYLPTYPCLHPCLHSCLRSYLYLIYILSIPPFYPPPSTPPCRSGSWPSTTACPAA